MTSGPAAKQRRRSGIAALAIIALFVVGFAATAFLVARLRDRMSGPRAAVPTLPSDGPITIALTGDTSLLSWPSEAGGPLDEVANLVRRASVGFTNFERFGRPGATPDYDAEAAALRALGFDVVSLANNHTMDAGDEQLAPWLRALDGAGVVHAGAGMDLGAARLPAAVHGGSRSVAFIAVTASVQDDAVATATRADIRGRAGVSPLRYSADITVDAQTFAAMAQSVAALNAGPPPGERELTMFGTQIRRGDRTAVEFTVNAEDRDAILESVRAARAGAELVVLSLHAHEPWNGSEAPADFVRDFARGAVEAGAQLVVGHGPHRIRGMERYRNGLIFYSLGHFSFNRALDLERADPADAGRNLLALAGGADALPDAPARQLQDGAWWEGLLVQVTAEGGRILGGSIRPLQLVSERPFKSRGLPGLASGAGGESILRRFAALSGDFQAPVKTDPAGLFLDLPIPESR